MPRSRIQCEALTPGQLARRWGLAVDRVRQLIETGRLPGAFKVPAAGRYGEVVKIPLATVIHAEKDWAIVQKDTGTGRVPTNDGDGCKISESRR